MADLDDGDNVAQRLATSGRRRDADVARGAERGVERRRLRGRRKEQREDGSLNWQQEAESVSGLERD